MKQISKNSRISREIATTTINQLPSSPAFKSSKSGEYRHKISKSVYSFLKTNHQRRAVENELHGSIPNRNPKIAEEGFKTKIQPINSRREEKFVKIHLYKIQTVPCTVIIIHMHQQGASVELRGYGNCLQTSADSLFPHSRHCSKLSTCQGQAELIKGQYLGKVLDHLGGT